MRKDGHEQHDTAKFIKESTFGTIRKIIAEEQVDDLEDEPPLKGLGMLNYGINGRITYWKYLEHLV